jgi:hypothetical protein
VIDLGTYLLLFVTGTVPVVLVTAFLTHADDATALRDVPRRALVFVGSCAAVAAALIGIGSYVG